MSPPTLMYDSDTPSQIPANAEAVAAYKNNATFKQLCAIFYPHAHCFSITTDPGQVAACLDVEPGAASASDVNAWFDMCVQAGVWRPCFYAQRFGVMPAMQDILKTRDRTSYRLWVADWDGIVAVPDGFDAKQFETQPGRYDVSVLAPNFFP